MNLTRDRGFFEEFLAVVDRIKRRRRVGLEDYLNLKKRFGERFLRALKAIYEERVKKYVFQPGPGQLFVVVGEEKDYLVIPETRYCSCKATMKGVIEAPCYHIIALEIANALGLVKELTTEYELYNVFIREFK